MPPGALGDLRPEPTEKRIRVQLGTRTVVDTTDAVLVWEPRRVVPSYAVPESDIAAELLPAPPDAGDPRADAPVLHPGIPFAMHSVPGDPFHRVDACAASRHVRIEVDGVVLAETTRPTLVFETGLPTRFYLPREDLVAEACPTERRTRCAYKGEAS
jgi:uncharacterized protein (DUF427 family)